MTNAIMPPIELVNDTILSPVRDATTITFDKKVRLSSVGASYLDINFSVGNLARGSSAPDIIQLGTTGISVLAFDGGVTLEQVFGVLEIDHNWAIGSIIFPHIHWLPTTTGAGSVKWNFEYVVLPNNTLLGDSTTISVSQTAGGVAWFQKIVSFPHINMSSFTNVGPQFYFRLYRDPTEDDYTGDAAVATFGLHVLVDSFGSDGVASKS